MKKKILLFLASSILVINIKAQDCKYEKNETDKFTNEAIVITKSKDICYRLIGETIVGKIQKVKNNNFEKLTFLLSVRTGDEWLIGFKKGQKLYIKFDNDSVLILTGNLDKDKMYFLDKVITKWWYVDNEYDILRKDLEMLKKYKISSVRLTYYSYKMDKENTFDYEYKKRQISSDDLLKIAKYIQ